MSATGRARPVDYDRWRAAILAGTAGGGRLAALTATAADEDTVLLATTADAAENLHHTATLVRAEDPTFRTLTDQVPAALWYEREIHDLFGLVPTGHPRLDPLILNRARTDPAPRPGSAEPAQTPVEPQAERPAAHVSGEGVFVYPHGPVRSGAVESIEYDIETPGEDIPYPQIRVYYKHRGLQKRFEGLTPDDGIVLAERVEGIASVAHAIAFASAVEDVQMTVIPAGADRVRIIYAELERIANHLDVATRLCDAAALAVATARFAWHKERILRLVSACSGSRFGRGIVVPGGVRSLPDLAADRLRTAIVEIVADIRSDASALMSTPSFLDRVRGTGILNPELADRHGALGPIGRACGVVHDVRHARDTPYTGLRLPDDPPRSEDGDAQARLTVRWAEIDDAAECLRAAIDSLDELDADSALLQTLPPDLSGTGAGRVEAPQGELLYLVDLDDGHLTRCRPRTASFHNLPMFHAVFSGDILTDFPFIEASFGLTPAGVVL